MSCRLFKDRSCQYCTQQIDKVNNKTIRWGIYLFIACLVFVYGNFNKTEFIYFAF